MKAGKVIFGLLAVCGIVWGIVGCTQKENEIPTPKLTFTEKVDADFESVTLYCTVSGNMTAEKLSLEYAKDQGLSVAQKMSFEKKGDGFSVVISGLEIQTEYYYRYTVENKASSFTDEKVRQFKTLDYSVPTVITGDAKHVSGTRATLEGEVVFTCGKSVTAQGFRFGKDKGQMEDKPAGNGDLTVLVEGLEFGTLYYYQAYATTEIGTGYGDVKEFTTSDAVTFKEIVVRDITASSAVVSGGILDNGGAEIEICGFRYSEETETDVQFIENKEEYKLEGLKAGATYKVWYYAKTFEGEFESEKKEFTTADGTIGFGETVATEITASSVSLSTSVTTDGGSPITERGFVYGTSALPTIETSKIVVAGSIGQLTGTIANLTNNTLFYIRPYAINGIGVSYGAQITVSTQSGLAELGQTTVSEVGAASALFSSVIVSANGATVSSCGFCYSLAQNPTTVDSKVVSQTTSGQISAKANSLMNNTTYYVRAFATTDFGTTYGQEVSFTTSKAEIKFSGLTLTDIGADSATASVTITDDGGEVISEKGFCFSTSAQPSISDGKVISTASGMTFSESLTSLGRNQKYYIRAYATNAFGTYYSDQSDFTTVVTVTSITLNKTSLSMVVGDSETLVATVLPTDAVDKSVVWSSDNSKIASVNDGVVVALEEGETTITANAGGVSATCSVTVRYPGPSEYLTFKSTGTTSLSMTNKGNNNPLLYYSYDRKTWFEWDHISGTSLSFSKESPLYLYGVNTDGFSHANGFRNGLLPSDPGHSSFSAIGDSFTCEGSVMSLLDGYNPPSVIPDAFCFFALFYKCSLITAGPSLPSTVLTQACYANMFNYCTSLSEAPSLPATVLSEGCYASMFYYCFELTKAPVLPAPKLVKNCYEWMFTACQKLNYIKCLATEIPDSAYLDNWTASVAASGTFVKSVNMNDWQIGKRGIPSGWTIENE